MKKLLSLLLAAVMLICMVIPASARKNEDLLDQIKERGYLIIATEGDWSPWTYHNEDGELVGFDVEVGKLIAEYLGVEARFEETAWDSILAGVQAGRFDIACNGVDYSDARAEAFLFSEPYVYSKTVLMVSGDNTAINAFADLQGKKTANTISSTYAAVAQEYGATVTPVDSLNDTIELLLTGRIDATINSEVSYLDYMSQHPEANIRIADAVKDGKVCYPINRCAENESLLEAINACLQELRDNGTLAELSEKYFFGDITNP